MTMGMAWELADHGISCNAVAPGYIDSRLLAPDQEHLRGDPDYGEEARKWIPSRRIGISEDIAGVVLFLCSPAGGYVNGQCITADGAFLAGGVPQV